MRTLRDHHQRTIGAATKRILDQHPDALAVLVAGSIAKGIEREHSDVDLLVVVSDEAWRPLITKPSVGFLWRDLADWPGGYVEGKFISKSYLMAAAERGSEPTRDSFRGVYPVFCTDPAIAEVLPSIAVYPEHERQQRIEAFLAQMQLNRWYFWNEGKRRKDPYLTLRAASDIVLFGGRLVLAHNRILFPCHKRLMELVASASAKPDGIVEKGARVLNELSVEAKEDFCKSIEGFTRWTEGMDVLSRFIADAEMNWFTGTPSLADW